MSMYQLTLQSLGEDKAHRPFRINDGVMQVRVDATKTITKKVSDMQAGDTILVPVEGWMRIINITSGAFTQTDENPKIVDGGGSRIMENN